MLSDMVSIAIPFLIYRHVLLRILPKQSMNSILGFKIFFFLLMSAIEVPIRHDI